MIAINKKEVNIIQKKYLFEIENQRIYALNKLKKINKYLFDTSEKKYLNEVISLFENGEENIILYEPKEIRDLIDTFSKLPSNSRFYKNKKPKKQLKQFILEALNYKSLRSSFYPKYFNELGIKACVYCNSQLTISAVKNSKNEMSAKFDVDHYHSKDDYPFLSISLFNLYPACAPCNRLKSTNKIEFELYTDKTEKTIISEYRFKLESNAKAKYLTTKDKKSIEFVFEEPNYSNPDVNKFNEVFHIEGIYKTQLDLIEDLIIKSQIYNASYLKTLRNNFDKLNLHPELFKRALVGNYTEDKDIHKRPMSKIVMDIAKELELIK